MKQRIRIVGLIQQGEEILFLKRRQSRIDGAATWELPTGKIEFGEQPEEAIARIIFDSLNVRPQQVQIRDAITFVAPAEASRLHNLYIIYDINLEEGQKIIARDRYVAYKYMTPEGAAIRKMDEASRAVVEIEMGRQGVEYRGVVHGATVYVDGASRGNPGPAGIGYYIVDEKGAVLKRGGEFIGFADSRVAEYYALKEGIEQALELGLKSVRFVGDNLMMINQMKGIYKIKNRNLVQIYQDIQAMLTQFEHCAFMHVLREYNREADLEANLAIDRHFNR